VASAEARWKRQSALPRAPAPGRLAYEPPGRLSSWGVKIGVSRDQLIRRARALGRFDAETPSSSSQDCVGRRPRSTGSAAPTWRRVRPHRASGPS